MVGSKRKLDEGSYELRDDPANYGTAASQRPRREIKRPTSVSAVVSETFAKKVQPKQSKVTSMSKKKPVTKKAKVTTQALRKQPPRSEASLQLEQGTVNIESRSTAIEDNSQVDNTLGLAPKDNASRRSARLQRDDESESTHVLEPAPLEPQVVNSRKQKTEPPLQQADKEQSDQQVIAPVFSPLQGVASPNASQTKSAPSQESTTAFWVPQTPGDSPNSASRYLHPEAFETPQRVPSQDAQRSFSPPTLDSLPRHVPSAAQCAEDPLQVSEPTIASQGFDDSQPTLPISPTRGTQSLATIVASNIVSETDPKTTNRPEDPEDLLAVIVSEQQLYAISEQLFAHRKSDSAKPEPNSQPEVWADGRQELCETLHYYRAYQGACYSTGGFVRGFMFDKIAHVRDYTDSNVVISRAGGGLAKDKDSGEMKAGRDQVEDTVAHGLRNCMIHCNPVVIITGVDNPHIPSKPPHQYCVLDYFKPTHIWVEKSGGSKIVRYRFEKLNTKKDSWWRPKNMADPVDLGSLPPPIQQTCQTCGVPSPQVYLNGWMCLQPDCMLFWNLIAPDSTNKPFEPEEASLIYDPRFLKQKTPWHNDDHEYPLVSNNAQLSGYSVPGEDTSQAFWLGMVCPECGRCNSRLGWMGWECQNPECDFRKEPPHTLIPAVSLREPLWPLTSSYTLSRDTQAPLIGVRVTFAYGYRINRYAIPGIDGLITHMIANKTVLEEPGGPDTMFEELQQTDIGLRRRPMPNGQLKGQNYCRHFTVNYGMPYKFIAATASQSFSDAARPITATRSRLNWATKLLLSQEPNSSMADVEKAWKEKEFNEVLALGYFEQQKINYHDDGEYGLGPTIATLSLGAPGTMRIRMKARHYHGVSSAGVYDDAPPLPGCQQYAARLALQTSLDALKLSDSKAYTARRKQIPKELKLKSAGQAKDVLCMQLGHGDVVVMHGRELQRYYEHAVEHAGKLRFALTCRYIDATSLKEADKPEYEVGPDVEGYDGSSLG